jgi:hypothetical protein
MRLLVASAAVRDDGHLDRLQRPAETTSVTGGRGDLNLRHGNDFKRRTSDASENLARTCRRHG